MDLAVLFRLFFLASTCLGLDKTYSKPSDIASGGIKDVRNLVIKLALFGDSEFEKRFQNDKNKLQRFLEVVTYDVYLRFKTLPSFNITLRVTSISSYPIQEEPSVYQKIEKENNFKTVDELRGKFGAWVYNHVHTIPSFDVAILFLGTGQINVNMRLGFAMQGSICRAKDDMDKKWHASTVISLLGNPAEILTKHIAIILGAPSDDDPSLWRFCDATRNKPSHCCILGENANEHVEARFFSHCTDKFLAQAFSQLALNNKMCLEKMKDTKVKTIIDSGELFQHPNKVHAYTLEEQCQILSNTPAHIHVFDPDGDPCLGSICVADSYNFLFRPLEASLCGSENNGQCLRGTCIQHRAHLVNVGTGKCLVPEKGQFASGDKPVLLNCSEVSTQLLPGTEIERWGNEEIYKATFMYSTSDGPNYKDLRLSGGSELIFDSRRAMLGSHWILRRLQGKNRHQFLLQNRALGSCITAGRNGANIEITSNCTDKDAATVWTFIKVDNGTELGCYHILYKGFKWGYFQRILNAGWFEIIMVCIFFVFLTIYFLIWLYHEKSHRRSWKYIKERPQYVYRWIFVGKKQKCRKVKKK